jgi:SNF2 family DNA or RNA helicase
MPGFFGGSNNFNSKYKVKEFNDEENKRLSTLNSQISPFILRRKKSDVVKDLPDKIENIIYVDLSEEQKKLYAAEVKKVKQQIDEIMSTEGILKVRFLIVQLLTKLRQLCIDPRIVYENYKGTSNKIENLKDIVKKLVLDGHKILIFTSFKTALEIARTELANENITSYTIDGSVKSKKRMELVDKFNEDDTNVFFIMLKAGGTGLNLTGADVVIHLDLWWNPQAENQATDRAHRIGQKNTVEVIKLVATGTIEEKILEMQQKKKMLSDKVIEGDEMAQNILSKLSEKDIKNLLSYENKNE